MTRLGEQAAKLRRQSVLVIGDVMLDQFLWGTVRRISPEAPVPVVEVSRRSYMPGGAANVAANIVALGGRASLVGVIGKDEPGDRLIMELDGLGVNTDGLVRCSRRATTCKSRIVAHSQQMVRFDEESTAPLNDVEGNRLLDQVRVALQSCSTCILSDYAKGVLGSPWCERVIALAREAGASVIVDPKGKDYQKYTGAALLTPNLHEAEAASGLLVNNDVELERAAVKILAALPGSSLLVTRGADGMSLFQPGQEARHVPTVARAVYDVTGAGDTVIATLALAIAAGSDLATAADLSNHAAGLAVAKLGTATVNSEELITALEAEEAPGSLCEGS